MNRNRFAYFAFIFASVIGVPVAAAPPASPVMAPGLWQITIQTRTPVVGVPITHTVCIDKALFTHPDPPKSRSKDDCQVLNVPGPSNELGYSIHCTKSKASSSAHFVYLGDHFDGTATVNDGSTEFQQVISGVRVGDCDDSSQPPAGPDAKKP